MGWQAANRQHIRSITPVEVCVCGLIVEVLLPQAAPTIQRLQGVDRTLMTDLWPARGEAVPSLQAIQFRFSRRPAVAVMRQA